MLSMYFVLTGIQVIKCASVSSCSFGANYVCYIITPLSSLLFIAIFRLFTVFTHCLLYIILLEVHIHNPPCVRETGVHG